MIGREIVPYRVDLNKKLDALALSIVPPQEIAPVSCYFAQAIHHLTIAPPPPHLLQDKPPQLEAPKIKVPKEINLLPPRPNEMLTGVKDNKFEDVTCAKYKSIMPRVAIDDARVAPEQVKIVLPKEKKKRAPPVTQENEEKHQ
jgi:hypothetical protein